MSKSLDIGCGDIPRNPFDADEIYGVDVRDNLEGNIRCADLAIERIPFPDDHFDYVTAHDFLEHIPRVIYVPCEATNRLTRRNAFIELMNEVYRVLKPGGLFLSITPGFPNDVAFRDPTHVNFITDETFQLYFDDKNRWGEIYGFKGAFRISTQKCGYRQVRTIMQKIEMPDSKVCSSIKDGLISVIIPVFNGEKHLSSTLDSLLCQTYKNFEAICVDDCSTDSSNDILQGYARNDARIKVVTTPQNLGSAAKVLDFIKDHINGKFFVYSSQDDLFSVDWLESMHNRKIETNAEAVIPEVVLYHDNDASRNRSLKGVDGDDQVILTGRKAFELSLNWRIPGNALWNSEILRRIGFEDFAANADEFSVRKFLLNSGKIAFSNGTFYYRQSNDQAITKKKSPNSFDWPYTQLRVAQLLQEHSFPDKLVNKEINSAVSSMNRLKKWFSENKSNFNSRDVDLIESKIDRFEHRLKFKYPFSDLPEQWKMPKTSFEEKWKRSFWRLKLKLMNSLM